MLVVAAVKFETPVLEMVLKLEGVLMVVSHIRLKFEPHLRNARGVRRDRFGTELSQETCTNRTNIWLLLLCSDR